MSLNTRQTNYKVYALVLLLAAASFIAILFLSVFIRESEKEELAKAQSSDKNLFANKNISESLISKIEKITEKPPEDKEEDLHTDKNQKDSSQTNEDFFESYIKYKETNNLLDRSIEIKEAAPPEPNTSAVKTNQNEMKINAKNSDSIDRALNSKTRAELSGNSSFFKEKRESSDSSESSENEENPLNEYKIFKRKDFRLNESVVRLSSPYVLQQGVMIKAVMLTAVSSEIPGQVKAMVSQDIYDNVTHRHLLIPKGSTLLGQYASKAAFGAERLIMGFSRILFPDGSSLNLGAMPAASADGSSGLAADVDNHYFRIIANSILLSSITASADSVRAKHSDANGNINFSSRFEDASAETISRTLSRLIEKNVNLAPTLNIRPGYPFSISLTKDIYFEKPY